MKKFQSWGLFVLIVLGNHNELLGQKPIGTVLDSETNLPIGSVHIYQENQPQIGTVTNSEGEFLLNSPSGLVWVFSHVGYELVRKSLSADDKEVKVYLKPLPYALKEVVVSSMGVNEIMENVISRLDENHLLQPVIYRFHSRIIEVSPDSTQLFLIDEMAGKMLHRRNSTWFHITKLRFKYFSKEYEKIEGRRRFISSTEMYTDNLYQFEKPYFHPKKSFKNYSFIYEGDVALNDRECYIIRFDKTGNITGDSFGWIYVDKETYAIARLKSSWSSGGYWMKDIYFQMVSDKWHLSHTIYKRNNSWREKLPSIEERQTIYEMIGEDEGPSRYILKMSLSAEFVDKYAGDFFDPYWDEHPFIPLPTWLQTKISESEIIKP